MTNPPEPRVWLDDRRHVVVVAAPLARALAAAAVGGTLFWFGWPYTLGGVVLLCVAAGVALGAVLRWDRTRVVVTDEKIVTVDGVVARRTTAIPLERLPFVEVEQPLFGRVLGYGTIVAGELEITHVPDAGRVHGVASERLSARRGRRPAAA